MSVLEQKIRGTIARGYCDDQNCMKELDSVLLDSIAHEIMLSLSPTCHPDRRWPVTVNVP